MKMSSVEELRKHCSKASMPSTREQLTSGPTSWFWGVPVKADEGVIEFAQETGEVLIVREDDILNVIDSGAGFAIRVKDDANLILRQELLFVAGETPPSETSVPVVPYGFNTANWLPEYDDSIIGSGGNAFEPGSCTTVPYFTYKTVKTVLPETGETVVVKVPTMGFKRVCGVEPYPPGWVRDLTK